MVIQNSYILIGLGLAPKAGRSYRCSELLDLGHDSQEVGPMSLHTCWIAAGTALEALPGANPSSSAPVPLTNPVHFLLSPFLTNLIHKPYSPNLTIKEIPNFIFIANTMADLPAEVITDIFCRLPVTSLLRFRSASKSLRSLVDSHHFINLHLSKSQPNTTLVLRHDTDLYQADLRTLTTVVHLNHPLMCYSNCINILGSCNGLLCICNVAEDIAFWNPNLRKHRILPYIPSARRPDPDTSLFAARVYGFGHDCSSDDYKLVRISYFVDLHNRTFDSQVKLYSLRTNAWKTLPSMPYALCCARTMGVFVHGNLHWVVTRKLEPDQPDLIVAFDLRFEIFREVPLPELGNDDYHDDDVENFEIDVALLGGCLCMIANYRKRRIDVWVMKEYGLKSSWCKLFVLVESLDLRSLKSVRPLGYSIDGFKVLLEHNRRKLFWYDLKNKEIAYIRIPGIPNLIEGMVCMGTLVPPSLLSDNCRNQHKLGVQNTKKRRDDFLSQGFKLTL